MWRCGFLRVGCIASSYILRHIIVTTTIVVIVFLPSSVTGGDEVDEFVLSASSFIDDVINKTCKHDEQNNKNNVNADDDDDDDDDYDNTENNNKINNRGKRVPELTCVRLVRLFDAQDDEVVALMYACLRLRVRVRVCGVLARTCFNHNNLVALLLLSHHDHSVMLEWLLGTETNFLPFLLSFLKFTNHRPEHLQEFVKSCRNVVAVLSDERGEGGLKRRRVTNKEGAGQNEEETSDSQERLVEGDSNCTPHTSTRPPKDFRGVLKRLTRTFECLEVSLRTSGDLVGFPVQPLLLQLRIFLCSLKVAL